MPDVDQMPNDEEFPTFESTLRRINRTLNALEKGTMMPGAGNAIFRGAQTVGQYAKIELEAVRLLGFKPKLMPHLLGGMDSVLPAVGTPQEKPQDGS